MPRLPEHVEKQLREKEWKPQMVNYLTEDDFRIDANAWVRDTLAVNWTDQDSLWQVFHIPTELAVVKRILTRGDAIRIGDYLLEEFGDVLRKRKPKIGSDIPAWVGKWRNACRAASMWIDPEEFRHADEVEAARSKVENVRGVRPVRGTKDRGDKARKGSLRRPRGR